MTLVRLLLAAALALLSSLALAQPIFPPGSRIGIVPPPGMTKSDRFQGFEDRARGAVLVVTELSAQSFAKVEKDFSDEQMRAGGMELIAREIIETPGGPAQLIGARQMENGVVMRKWALLTRTDDMTAIVVAALPEAAKDAYPDAVLRAALASAFIRARPSHDDMLAVLPYRLGDLGEFRILRAGPDGTAVFTLGPNDTTLPVEQPYFLVALRTVEPPQPSERDNFARRALASFINRPDLRIVASEQVRIGGQQGHELVAESEDGRTRDPLMTVQWLRFGNGGVIQMLGIARKDQWADVLPRMRALRDGFERK
ncbi:MAG TPA: hypothetical protein VJT13_24970 [Xanthobacteraceae bacterium]|nr:hypothetical protein [Xanthobacteraceae bacterium]